MKYSDKQIAQVISILRAHNIPDHKIAMIITNLTSCSIYCALDKVKETK